MSTRRRDYYCQYIIGENPQDIDNSGVKQGCPLSILLFNMIIDELIERISKSKDSGVKLLDSEIPIMGFADDLVLLANNNFAMT